MKYNSNSVLSNMLWKFADKWLEQLIGIALSVILARLLVPEEYGVVALITVFTSILQVFVDSGFSSALIQKIDADQLDFSTVFWFNIGVSVFLYALMFLFAPLIARFYNKEYIIPHIRVMSLTLIIGGLNGVQHVMVSKRMIFKKLFVSSLLGTVISAVIGIVLAYKGFGAWALVAQRLSNQIIDGFFLWIMVKWIPSFRFSGERLKPLFSYGSKLLGSSLLYTVTGKLSSLLIGKFYTSADLAFYEKGGKIPASLVTNLEQSVQSVLFPVMADAQNDRQRVKEMLRKSVKVSAFLIFPMMMGLGVCADSLIKILYTDKWAGLTPHFHRWCFLYAFYLLQTANLQVLRALGRSDIFLKLDIIKQTLGLLVMAVTLPFGVLPMLTASCVSEVIALFINAYPNKKLVGYGFLDQLKDIFPIFLLNVIMGALVFLVGKIDMAIFPKLVLQIVTGVAVYFGGSRLLQLDVFSYIIKMVKKIFIK